MDWLMSETGTVAFCVGIIALYVGLVSGLLLNHYWVERGDDGDDEDVVVIPPSPVFSESL